MRRRRERLTHEDYGELVAVDHPLPLWMGWAVILAGGFLIGGWLFLVPGPPWLYAVPCLVISTIVSMYIFGERFLIEQRLHERVLVSRSLVPFVGIYALPLAAIDPDTIRTTPTFRWTDPGEAHLPAARALRCKPWGPVLRLRGPRHQMLKSLRQRGNLVPQDALALEYSHSSVQEWIFSFSDLDDAEQLLRDLIRAEARRLGPTGFSDPRSTVT